MMHSFQEGMMRPTLSIAILILSLTGCNNQDAMNGVKGVQAKNPGRYAGIGTFEAGRLWEQMAGAPASQDPKAATLKDDEHVIVVIDSHTGEVRQCGDHSGVCVTTNPWSKSSIAAPVKLTKNAADLDAEAEAGLTEPNRKATAARR
jgi:uncharacterized lipoprotein NlpE involved in copper resistance